MTSFPLTRPSRAALWFGCVCACFAAVLGMTGCLFGVGGDGCGGPMGITCPDGTFSASGVCLSADAGADAHGDR